METIHAYCVPNGTDVVKPLGAIKHVEQSIMMNDARVEDVERFPVIVRIRFENGIARISLQFHVLVSSENRQDSQDFHE
jgi:hypothetical protein